MGETDLISRQAAIDAICKACSMEEDYHKCDGYPETSTWCDYLVALRALPSTQPDIIRCKECRYYEWMNNRVPAEQTWFCHNWNAETGKDDYCSYAERQEE